MYADIVEAEGIVRAMLQETSWVGSRCEPTMVALYLAQASFLDAGDRVYEPLFPYGFHVVARDDVCDTRLVYGRLDEAESTLARGLRLSDNLPLKVQHMVMRPTMYEHVIPIATLMQVERIADRVIAHVLDSKPEGYVSADMMWSDWDVVKRWYGKGLDYMADLGRMQVCPFR